MTENGREMSDFNFYNISKIQEDDLSLNPEAIARMDAIMIFSIFLKYKKGDFKNPKNEKQHRSISYNLKIVA